MLVVPEFPHDYRVRQWQAETVQGGLVAVPAVTLYMVLVRDGGPSAPKEQSEGYSPRRNPTAVQR